MYYVVLFYKDGEKDFYVPSSGQSAEECLKAITPSLEREGRIIEKHVFIHQDDFVGLEYIDAMDMTKHGFARLDRKKMIEIKMREVRASRSNLFQELDLQSLMALESRDEEKLSKVVENKEFLRDIPQKNVLNLVTKESEIPNVNAFNNILFIHVTDPGQGYANPPKVTISPPSKSYKRIGFAAKAVSQVENGRVIGIKITDPGSNYLEEPEVSISAPKEGKQAKAKAELSNRVL